VWAIDVADRGSVPKGSAAVVANLTVTGSTGNGFATAFDCTTQPDTSTTNHFVGTTRPNETVTNLSRTGQLCVFTLAEVHVIIDIVGHT
jgi:hypothetical protein